MKKNSQKTIRNGSNNIAHQKNLALMKLLVSHEEFRKDIAEARKNLAIPSGGFIGKDADRLIKQWTDHMEEKSGGIMDSPAFRQQEKNIAGKLQRKEIGVLMAQKQSEILYNKIPLNYLKNTSRFLARKFNIPENFEDYIRSYMVRGVIDAPVNNFSSDFYPAWKKPSEVRYIPIKIYAQLTDPELQDLKKQIKLWGSKLPVFRPLQNIDKKLEIELWLRDRERYDPVEQKAYTLSAAEIAQNLLGGKKNKKKVYETVRGLRRLRKRRFK